MQQAKYLQQLKQSDTRQCATELTQRRTDHQTSLFLKEEEASRLAAAAILVPSKSAPMTDIITENIGLQHREHVAQNEAPPSITPEHGNLRLPQNLLNLWKEFHHYHCKNHGQFYRIITNRKFTSGY